MIFEKNHQYWKNLDWGIQITSIFLTIFYGCLLVDNFSYLFGNPFSTRFWIYLIEFTLKACLINLGLWISTTNFGRRHHYKTLGLISISLCAGVFIFLGVGQSVLTFLVVLIHIVAVYSLFKKRSIS